MSLWQDRGDGELNSWQTQQRFLDEFSREQVASHAEELLRRCIDAGGSCFTFRHTRNGLIGHSIRQLLCQLVEPTSISDELVSSLISELSFTPDWIPPRLLVRETLAFAVRLCQLRRQLCEEIGCTGDLNVAIEQAATELTSAEAAFLLSDEAVDRLIASFR